MKFLCPHCQTKSVNGFSKLKSCDFSPAVCSECGKFSTEPNWTKFVSGIYWGFGIWVTALWSLFSSSSLPLLITLFVFVVYEIWAFTKLPLRPIAEATVRRTRWEFYIFIIVLFLVAIFVYFL